MKLYAPFSHRVLVLIISSLMFASFVFAAAGDVDTSFNASAVRTNGSNLYQQTIKNSLLQTDGKILISGNFTTVGRYARTGIAKLNADGTVDTSFNPPEFGVLHPIIGATISAIGLQTDGKILVGGDFTTVNGVALGKLVRLNSDGTPDTVFNNNLPQQILSQFSGIIYDIKTQSTGKILLAGDISANRSFARFNADGTFDSSFTNSVSQMNIRKLAILPNGKIMVAGSSGIGFNYVGLARLHEDGSIDFSFSGVHLPIPNNQFLSGVVYDFEILPNSQFLICGGFTSVNGFTQPTLARINSDGSLDLSFNTNNAGGNGSVNTIDLLSDGKILITGGFSTFNNTAKPKIARLNADGSIDSAYSYTGFNDGQINTLQILPNGKLFVGGENGYWDRIQIINTDGSVVTGLDNLVGKQGLVKYITQQPDGKILVGGRFASANGLYRTNIVRFNEDGAIDASFVPFMESNQTYIVNKIIVQPNGKILLAYENSFNPQSPLAIRRLNADGTRDTTFSSGFGTPNAINDILLLPNGQVLAFGTFAISSVENGQMVRLNSDGSVNQRPGLTNGIIRRTALQPDGKVIIVGTFTQVFGNIRGRIARLNADLTLDTSFNPPGGANGNINDLALQPDGKIVVVGEFDALNGSSSIVRIGRLNSDGTLDTTFAQTADGLLYSVSLQNGGKILIGGAMSVVGGVSRKGLARLNSDGTLDNTFQVGTGANNTVWTTATQTNGKILIGGEFSAFNNNSQISIARLLNSSVTARPLFDFDGDGKADVSVYRASTNTWYRILSGNSSVSQNNFGIANDIPVPADFDGDGKTDLAIFRPSTGTFWYQSSINNAQIATQWGQNGDIPRPSDFDGDGKADFIIFRPSENNWYRLGSTGLVSTKGFGAVGDKPVTGDFDGDGKSDVAIFRPSSGDWWYQSSINNAQLATHFGASTDVPSPADFDGDGKTDFAVFRPSTGVWYILNSSTRLATIVQFGIAEDKPVPADYDGDGKSDIAVFRPSTGLWYLLRSTSGFSALQFGISSDVPLPNSFIP
jgi:uncharacterized delta-60 repeat protein